MSIQNEIENFITTQFDNYRLSNNGKNHFAACKAAKNSKSLDQWVFKEVSKGAIAGVGEMAIPGMGIPLAIAGITYLLYQMARVSWGVSEFKGGVVSETPGASDLGCVLARWGNDPSVSPEFLALSTGVVTEYISNENFQTKVHGLIDETENELSNNEAIGLPSRDKLILNSLVILPTVANMITTSPHSARLVKTVGLSATVSVGAKMAKKQLSKQVGKKVSKGISKRVATVVATRLATRVGARSVLTWIPVIGAAANGALNLTTLQSMKNAAIEHYSDKVEADDINKL